MDDADARTTIDDERDGHTEERDSVGVVDGAVEGIDDPRSAVGERDRRATGLDGAVLAGFLGQDPVAGEPGADRVEDQRLRQMIDLGHHVAGALVVDPLDALVALHEEPAGAGRDLEAEGQLVGERRAFGWTRGRRHDQ